MWKKNKILIDILPIYNLILDPLKGKYIIYKNIKFQIVNVFKEWKNGWFISLEIESEKYQDHYIKIPFKNINCTDQNITEKINIIQNLTRIENGPSSSEPSAKT